MECWKTGGRPPIWRNWEGGGTPLKNFFVEQLDELFCQTKKQLRFLFQLSNFLALYYHLKYNALDLN